ncbi:MAG: hypothetical protein FJ096_08520 [Deltaproteobacteria bacterium]|nr:hypothetical protein [Deltaproteobacteria bacterium]
MRSMTDEGFVWLDAPETRRSALVVVPARPATALPAAVSAPPKPLAHRSAGLAGKELVGRELVRHQPSGREPARWSPARGMASRLVAVALATLRGRRAVLGACLELTDALALELRRALS